MSVSVREWQWLRGQYGDLAYEHPELHTQWLTAMPRLRLVVDNAANRKPANWAGFVFRDELFADTRMVPIALVLAFADGCSIP